ncbi:DUF6283 family protein [Frigidibacter oleivorans]|uniref:DUF6283 family protein n=1 Tax=Frigidibacter oleivorans TaxID=2487129 RepID=UPI000F8CB98B|nr:DUF6283 family protein [Frigidibacter oleivorans]
MLKPPPAPCRACPYRTDAPAGAKAEDRYETLAAYDLPTPFQPEEVLMCDERKGCLCGGWLMSHDRRQLLALQLHADRVDPSVWDYAPDVEVFASGHDAADHGLSGLDAEDKQAPRRMAGTLYPSRLS